MILKQETSVRGCRKILRYIHDGNAAIWKLRQAVRVIDLSTGEDLTRSTDLQDWEKMQVVEMPVRSGIAWRSQGNNAGKCV